MNWQSTGFVTRLTDTLTSLATERGFLDGEMLKVEDLDRCWERSAPQYLADAVPEVAHYPTVAVAWAAFFGLGAAKLWDSMWDYVKDKEDLYVFIRDVRGFDAMDDYVIEGLLTLRPSNPTRAEQLTSLLQEAAETAITLIRKEQLAPQSPEAYYAFAKTCEVMFKLGVAIQMRAMGYKYQRMEVGLN